MFTFNFLKKLQNEEAGKYLTDLRNSDEIFKLIIDRPVDQM